jgi:hypothetical protein
MRTEKAEPLKSLAESGTPADLWTFISNDTEIERDLCKTIIFQMIFGDLVIETAIACGLRVDEIVAIRMAFDQYTYEHKKVETDAIHQTS